LLPGSGVDGLDLRQVAAMGQLPWGPIVMGSLVALLIGILSLELLVQAVMRAKLHYFAVYCWLLGGLVLAGFI
jgi:undecaprenyl pyrophosphate phosphatase UppP